jgi:putative holliday junction resolvase
MKATTSSPSIKPRTVLGFDFGLHHIGVAIGQEITYSASPVTTLIARDGQPRWEQITALLKQWQPDLLVVGLPFNMDGSEQSLTAAARRFGNRLRGRYGLPVEWVDERLSTVEARERLYLEAHLLSRHRDLDQLAAQCILQTWLREQPSARA